MPLTTRTETPIVDTGPSAWPLHDYISPGLAVVRPDAAFPHMRAGDALHHRWKYLRRDVPHIWYVDDRFPLMGFLNRDEAILLHNLARQFRGQPALEIGGWLGWSTCHLALAGVDLDVVDPALARPEIRSIVEHSLEAAGVRHRVRLIGRPSPDGLAGLDSAWHLIFVDGNHEDGAPARDALAALEHAADDCAFVFHDVASPDVADALRLLRARGFRTRLYQTAQVMGFAWRGEVSPVRHTPDPTVAWQVPVHLLDFEIATATTPAAQSRRFVDLAADSRSAMTPAPALAPRTVCLVASEIIGPFKNGGIGTATTGLAEWLAADGWRVTILYTGGIWFPDVSLQPWKARYAGLGIELAEITIDQLDQMAGPVRDCGFGLPWLVYRFLAEHRFDVVHFNDCCGEGSLSLAAKKMRLALADSLLAVGLHSPSRWVLELNQTLPVDPMLAAFDCAERVSIACADVLWSPSRYLLDWVTARGFELPAQTFIQPYVMPSHRLFDRSAPDPTPRRPYGPCAPPKEIVFFGRLEERKGLQVFCQAVSAIADEVAARGLSVTFLGKPGRCAGQSSLQYIAAQSKSWGVPVRMLTTLGQPEALAYLADGDKLAVMPSPADNSPCTVYEALALHLPFLAARTGGIPELIAPADRDRVLFPYGVPGLRESLRAAMSAGAWVAQAAVTPDAAAEGWRALHDRWQPLRPPVEAAAARPRLLAAIIDHTAGARLDLTLDSLCACPSRNRFIVINRSGDRLSVDSFDVERDAIDTLESQLADIVEDAVLLIHSGVSVDPVRFEAMLAALDTSGADGLMPASTLTVGDRTRIVAPLGGSVPFSLTAGVTYTGGLLVTREALIKARSGRALLPDQPFLGLADQCVLTHRRIWPYPEPVLTRQKDVAIGKPPATSPRLELYSGADPGDRYYLLAAALKSGGAGRTDSTRWWLALAAVDAGLAPVVKIGMKVLRRLTRWAG